jgi:hypothetical protein
MLLVYQDYLSFGYPNQVRSKEVEELGEPDLDNVIDFTQKPSMNV